MIIRASIAMIKNVRPIEECFENEAILSNFHE
jgi:hypothetical protein